MKKINHKIMYGFNKLSVLKLLMENKMISRAQISRKLNLNKPTVSRIINEFVESNIILEKYMEHSNTVGKKPLLLYINPGLKILGLWLDVGVLRYAISDLYGNIVVEDEAKFSSDKNLKKSLEIILYKIKQNFNYKFIGIGISVPGVVNKTKIIFSYALNINDFDISFIKEIFPSSAIVVSNDVESVLLAERNYIKLNLKNVLYFFMKVNYKNRVLYIGSRYMIDGKIVHGYTNYAGELHDLHLKGKDKRFVKVYSDGQWEMNDELTNLFIEYVAKYVMFLNPEHLILGGDINKNKDLMLVKKVESKLVSLKKEYSYFKVKFKISVLENWDLKAAVSIVIDKIKSKEIKL